MVDQPHLSAMPVGDTRRRGEPDVERRLAALGLERVDVVSVTTEAIPVEDRRWRVTMTRPAMGTLVSVTSLVDSPDRADEAVGRAFDEMDRLIGIFSLYDCASALTRLNEAGRLAGAPPELTRVARAGLDYHRISNGAFEMTVGPVLEALRREAGNGSNGARPALVHEAMARVGSQHVRVTRRSVRFDREGMGVTFDGIAKGDIVDAVATVLDRQGVSRYVVNAGGDIRVRGKREGGRPWVIAVRDPADPEAFLDTISLTGGAVATSGGYENHFDPEMINHHIVDARTGRSPPHATSVSVVAPTAMDADALATTVFVLGPTQGVAFVDRLPGVACLVIDRQDRRWASRHWPTASELGGGHRS